MLLISILLGLIPLAGIAWIIVTGTITTVDGLFECLIMLSISGIFFLNVFWELRDHGSWGRARRRSPPSRRRPPKRVRDQGTTWPVLHPPQKMVINQNWLGKTPRRSRPRRRITRCPRGIARCFSSPPG